MKKILLIVVACIVLALVLSGQEVQIKDGSPFSYAYLECSGSYAQISAKIGEFMGEFLKQGLAAYGPPFGLYLNSPAQVKSDAELKWLVGMAIEKEASVAAPLKKGEFAYAKTAVATHVGPFDQVGATFGKMMQFIEQSGYKIAGPSLENWLDNPQAVSPEKLRTEIIIPVEKK